MAEGLLKKTLKERGKKIMVSSAGIATSVGKATSYAIVTMKEMGIDISNHMLAGSLTVKW